MENLPYNEQVDKYNILKLRQLSSLLPPYCKVFFRGIEHRTQSRTRIAYAYDLKVFFTFLLNTNPEIQKKFSDISQITLDELEKLTNDDFEEYMEYLKYREEERNIINKENSIKRKISSLKSFFKYFYNSGKINENTLSKVLLPKLVEKDIIRLDIDEVALMIDEIENGDSLSKKQKQYHEKTKKRDLAIVGLMLGTGIRVSECVGLNLNDIDLKNDGIRVHRKGGKEVTVYFSDELESLLLSYLAERKHMETAKGHEEALFISLQMKRISVRSVEKLVKKYAKAVAPLKKITPHKLRSTYGTNLYRETGDIYLVADVLGHSDVNTTKKHYAALEDDRRKKARNAVKLREDNIS